MDFKETDKVIRKVDACLHFLTVGSMHPLGKPAPGIFNQGTILKDRWPDLFTNLVDITNSTASEEEKQEQRYLAFAANYNKPGDKEFGKEMLTYKFDEQMYIDFINRNANSGFNSLTTEIEAEFWRNYQLIKDIGLLCNLYREQWRGYLPEIDVEYFSWENCLYSPGKNNTHEIYLNVKALRDCGLLKAKDVDFEVRFKSIAYNMNMIVADVVKFFIKMKRSTIDTKDLDNLPQPSNTNDAWVAEIVDPKEAENKFNQMPIHEVLAYFTPLFNTVVNGNKLLTDECQTEFINRIFLDPSATGKKLSFTAGATRGFVIGIFHKYYLECKDKYYEPSPNCSSKYKALLQDNFLGYETITNFRS